MPVAGGTGLREARGDGFSPPVGTLGSDYSGQPFPRAKEVPEEDGEIPLHLFRKTEDGDAAVCGGYSQENCRETQGIRSRIQTLPRP